MNRINVTQCCFKLLYFRFHFRCHFQHLSFLDDETDEEGDVPDSNSSDDHGASDLENSDILVDDYERYNF